MLCMVRQGIDVHQAVAEQLSAHRGNVGDRKESCRGPHNGGVTTECR